MDLNKALHDIRGKLCYKPNNNNIGKIELVKKKIDKLRSELVDILCNNKKYLRNLNISLCDKASYDEFTDIEINTIVNNMNSKEVKSAHDFYQGK